MGTRAELNYNNLVSKRKKNYRILRQNYLQFKHFAITLIASEKQQKIKQNK